MGNGEEGKKFLSALVSRFLCLFTMSMTALASFLAADASFTAGSLFKIKTHKVLLQTNFPRSHHSQRRSSQLSVKAREEFAVRNFRLRWITLGVMGCTD